MNLRSMVTKFSRWITESMIKPVCCRRELKCQFPVVSLPRLDAALPVMSEIVSSKVEL